MKIMGKVILGFIGSALLTAVILFALGIPDPQQAVTRFATFAGVSDAKESAQADDADQKETAGNPSIEADQHQTVHQRQEDTEQQNQQKTKEIRQDETTDTNQPQTSQPEASQQDGQANDGQQSGQSTAQTGQQAEADSRKNTFQTVTQDYFSDALFIGDSRTVGMQQSGLLPDATYYAKIGIGIGDILTQRIVSEGGAMISVEEALGRHSFGKVYIMIGINDMSRGDVDWFTEQYQEILRTVRQTQPNAVVYIQGNIPMSYRTQDFSGSLNNANLKQRNEASRQLADGETIFYLEVEDIYADANGHLDTTYSSDGLHVSTKYYTRWVDYLLGHAIVR